MNIDFIDIHSHHADRAALLSLSPEQYQALPLDFQGKIAVGIHPWDTDREEEIIRQQFDILKKAVEEDPRLIAIGEAGLDNLRGASLDKQIEIFLMQADLAAKHGKPMIIHCVRAIEPLIHALHFLNYKKPILVYHGFRGKPRAAVRLLREGFYISLGEHFNQETAAIIPGNRLLVESDESTASIEKILENIAAARNETATSLEATVTNNLTTIFG